MKNELFTVAEEHMIKMKGEQVIPQLWKEKKITMMQLSSLEFTLDIICIDNMKIIVDILHI